MTEGIEVRISFNVHDVIYRQPNPKYRTTVSSNKIKFRKFASDLTRTEIHHGLLPQFPLLDEFFKSKVKPSTKLAKF